MAEHSVRVKTPPLEVGKVDIVFVARQDRQVQGRLKVSRGGVEWMQRSDSKKAFHMSWDKFDRIFCQEGDQGTTRSAKWKPPRNRSRLEIRCFLVRAA